jgi:RecA/RadA recombinase
MSNLQKQFQQLSIKYQNFKLNPSKLKGTFRLNELYGLRADADIITDKWTVFDASTGETIPWEDAPELFIPVIQEFIFTWNGIKLESAAKDPIDTLKEHGFEDAPIVQDSPEETPINDAETRLREAEEAKLQEDEELERLKKENLALKAAKEEEEAERLRVEFPPALKKYEDYVEPDHPEEEVPPVTKGEVKLLDILYELIEDDLLQIFGHTGTGKTSIAMKAAFEGRERKKSVIYLDTEHNITKNQVKDIKKLGIVYEYIPKFDNLYTFIKKLSKYDIVIVDSLGLPVLAMFADANMKEKGVALQKMIAISAFLKNYANENHALVIVLNQPESDMNKDPLTERKPFGDKSAYCYKEIISSKFAKGGRTENKTTIVVKAFRSRSCGMGTKLFTVEITGAGIKVIQ